MAVKKIIILPVIFLLFWNGCLKDNITPPVIVNLESSAEILDFIESRGDYINSSEVPSIVSPFEVITNIDQYLILDIRSTDKFAKGRIEGAVNVKHYNLISYLDSININLYPKIVIVSETGQAAAYYNSFLRLYGFYNTFSLEFGMDLWNSEFGQLWSRSRDEEFRPNTYDNRTVQKPDFSELPKISFPEGNSIEEKIKGRINELMKEEFIDTSLKINSDAAINFPSLYNNYDYSKNIFENVFIICYGTTDLYYIPKTGELDNPGHPKGSVLYVSSYPINELRTTMSLQTIPNNQQIVIYSENGILSAYATAYLRLLGYNARSVLFGAYWRGGSVPTSE